MPSAEANRILASQTKERSGGWRDGNGAKRAPDGTYSPRTMNRVGTLNMEALVRQFGHEWKIISLRVAGNQPTL